MQWAIVIACGRGVGKGIAKVAINIMLIAAFMATPNSGWYGLVLNRLDMYCRLACLDRSA